MTRTRSFLTLAIAASLAACGDDGTVTPQGGAAFESPFAAVSQVRYPSMRARAFGRTVNNAAVVDSVVGEVSLAKQLDGRARYQFYLVNGLDGTATPVSHRQWTIRTDTLLDANGDLTTPVDTVPKPPAAAPLRDFWRGAFFGQKLRFAVTLSAADSVQQRAAWLVLTIQSDTTRTAFNDSTPRPLFVQFRDQKNTATRNDDVIPPDTLRGRFGDFINPARQTTFAGTGAGSLLLWDVAGTGVTAMRVDVTGLRKPPRGYYYHAHIIDSLSGVAFAWGEGRDADGDLLGNADLGTDSIIPVFRAAQSVNAVIGKPENYSFVDVLLEPKTAAPALRSALSIFSTMNPLRARVPDVVKAKRAALGTLQAIVTRGTQGGPAARNVGVVIQAAGQNFSTLLGNRNTDSTGTATFTGVPPGEIRVLAIPFGGSAVEGRATVVTGQTATLRLVVP